MNRRAFLAGTTGAVSLLTGCNQSGGSESETPKTSIETPRQTETPPTTPSPTQTTTRKSTESLNEIVPPALISDPEYVVTAEDGLLACSATLTDTATRNFERSVDDVVFAGPMAFLWAGGHGFKTGNAGRDLGPNFPTTYKTPIAVKQTRTVTLVVPKTERDNVALNFGPAGNTIEDGFQSVRFEPCENSSPDPTVWAVWAGGFLIKDKRCVTFHILTDDDSLSREVTLSFGAGACE